MSSRKRRRWHFRDPNLKSLWGSMPPDSPRLERLCRANFSSPACTFKVSRYAANNRCLIAYEINAQGWKKRLGPEGVGGGGFGCIWKIVIAKGVEGDTIFICNYFRGGGRVKFWYITLFWKPTPDWLGQKFLNNLACEFAVHFPCRNAEMNLISTTTNRFKSFKQTGSIFIYL